MQQEAARKLGFTVAQTMMVAQRLYENGQITYMRTDSVNLSDLALNTSKQTILSLMGERYVKVRKFATKTKGAQEAHEAIRPTYMENETVNGTGQDVYKRQREVLEETGLQVEEAVYQFSLPNTYLYSGFLVQCLLCIPWDFVERLWLLLLLWLRWSFVLVWKGRNWERC